MPHYDYTCSECSTVFERKLPSDDVDLPEKDPCPECNAVNTVHYAPSFSGIGDPMRLGITRAPDAYTHGILGRMATNVPVGIGTDKNGKQFVKHADFSRCRIQPGRMI